MLLRSASFSFVLISLMCARVVASQSTNLRLLQLVPPQSHLVAGMSHATGQKSTGSFFVLTRENKTDLKDFFSLTGGDASRHLSAMVFVASAGANSAGQEPEAKEHSLLVSGLFNRESIFRFAAAGARREAYRGIPVLVVPAFERERATFNEVRWLAIPDEHIAVFGSEESVQREIDRWVEHSAPDPAMLDQLRRLGGNDDSWCLLLAWDRRHVAESALGKLDAKLSAVANDPGMLGWGIKFGRKIQIVAVAAPISPEVRFSPEDAERAEKGTVVHSFSFMPAASRSDRVTVKVSRRRYEEWLARNAFSDPSLPGR